MTGMQPEGRMTSSLDMASLEGCEGCGTIVIRFEFPGGKCGRGLVWVLLSTIGGVCLCARARAYTRVLVCDACVRAHILVCVHMDLVEHQQLDEFILRCSTAAHAFASQCSAAHYIRIAASSKSSQVCKVLSIHGPAFPTAAQ